MSEVTIVPGSAMRPYGLPRTLGETFPPDLRKPPMTEYMHRGDGVEIDLRLAPGAKLEALDLAISFLRGVLASSINRER